MPERKNNLWCVVGANGVGKSSICDALAQTGEFKRIERDRAVKALWEEFGDFERFVRILNGRSNQRRKMVKALREKIAELMDWIAEKESISKPSGPTFLDSLKRVSAYADDDLIRFYSESEDRLYYLLIFWVQEKSLRQAVQWAKEGNTPVLLDDPHLLNHGEEKSEDAKAIREYLEAVDVEPSILIIRSTRLRIFSTALSRFSSEEGQGLWQGRAEAGIQHSEEQIVCPYRRVIVHDNVGELQASVATVRRRILEENFDQNIEWPLSLAVPDFFPSADDIAKCFAARRDKRAE